MAVAADIGLEYRLTQKRVAPTNISAGVIPDVVDTQQAGHHGSLGPSTRRGPERYSVRGNLGYGFFRGGRILLEAA